MVSRVLQVDDMKNLLLYMQVQLKFLSFELKNVLLFFDVNLYGFMDDVSNSNML